MNLKQTFVFALAASSFAFAKPILDRRDTLANECTTGTLQCCNSVQKGNNSTVALLFGLLGVVNPDPNGLVGVTCSPLSVIGVGGSSCSAQPVCCTGNSFNGLLVLGCTPVNINV
ncbi:hypothetical protein CVT26_015055 [Gymnopilus dilepis]|uniref:Hydrophobin n=1 Tax=Gymnopilus dilepis TaxID=231916 RepID=A0A409W449_9AGAR|nr:hypothetical protein CVT26_015055 [Gymnopilus dilepis]